MRPRAVGVMPRGVMPRGGNRRRWALEECRGGRIIASTKARQGGDQGVSERSRSAEAGDPKKLAVFASGGGSNFKAIQTAIEDGRINARVQVLVSDKAGCGATEFASAHGIPCLRYPDPSVEKDKGLGRLLEELGETHGVDYVLLAGYMKFIPPELVRSYPREMLNIHPALLPSFGGKGCYGMNVHEKVVDSGVRFTGATVHFVNEEYDKGRIVAQACVPVSPEDSPEDVASKVLRREHELYPDVVAALCDGRIVWREDGKPVISTVL